MSLSKEKQNVFIEQLYREMYIQLSIYVRSALNDSSLGEEAVQETFRIACTKVDMLMGSANPKGWLINTLKNVIRNIRRAHAKLYSAILNLDAFDEKTMGATRDEVDLEVLYTGLIPKEDFKLLRRIVLERYSLLEAAEELGISVEACKKEYKGQKRNFERCYRKIRRNNYFTPMLLLSRHLFKRTILLLLEMENLYMIPIMILTKIAIYIFEIFNESLSLFNHWDTYI